MHDRIYVQVLSISPISTTSTKKYCSFVKKEKPYHIYIYIYIYVGGQGLSFCVGPKAQFTSESTSEEEETFRKTP